MHYKTIQNKQVSINISRTLCPATNKFEYSLIVSKPNPLYPVFWYVANTITGVTSGKAALALAKSQLN